MNVFSVNISWLGPDGTAHGAKFTCVKAQVVPQINQALLNEVAPTFGSTCAINIQDLGPVRGPVS